MGDSIFSHVRTKLRQSRSSMALPNSSPSPPPRSNWDSVPTAYRPVERPGVRVVDGYYLNRPLPGPPPRPRTTSPTQLNDVRPHLDIGSMRNPTPRTHRTRSTEIAQRRWSGLDNRDAATQNKRASVNIATALPPAHLDPPPPYSRYDDPPSTGHESRPRSQPPPANTVHLVKPYDPSDYIVPFVQDGRRAVDEVPIIAAPHPPTPVSPINTLDLQYLTWRPRSPSGGSVTVDNLLAHPMLRHR